MSVFNILLAWILHVQGLGMHAKVRFGLVFSPQIAQGSISTIRGKTLFRVQGLGLRARSQIAFECFDL